MNLRPATMNDADRLYRWRVHDQQQVWGEHVTVGGYGQWLEDRIANPLVRLWIAEHDGVAVGQLRIDSNGELSFSIDPAFRGHGHGEEMVRLAVADANPATFGGHLKANAHLSNLASVRVLDAAGFMLTPGVGFFRR